VNEVVRGMGSMRVRRRSGGTVNLLWGIVRISVDPSQLRAGSRPMSMGLRPDVECNRWHHAE